MTASSLLHATANLLRSNWISNQSDRRDFRGVMALDGAGKEVRYDDEKARKFLLDGALLRCARFETEEGRADHFEAAQYLRSMRKWKTIADINDCSSHRQILDMLRAAENALAVDGRLAA